MARQAKTDLGTGIDPCPGVYLAFDQAVIAEPSFEAVIHTASSYHFKAMDVKKELLDLGKNRSSWNFAFWNSV